MGASFRLSMQQRLKTKVMYSVVLDCSLPTFHRREALDAASSLPWFSAEVAAVAV